MIYKTASDWLAAPQKRVLFFGMSGLGKTHVSNMLRASGGWFHYSVDYRIGTRYMGELIADNAKREAMQVPFLRDLLLSDSIYIGSNITFDNLSPVSSYLGKPGNPTLGGLPMAEFTRRQGQFQAAEMAALNDTPHFIDRAQALYDYPHFICDTGGSICEWVDGSDTDPLMQMLSQNCLMVWIKGSKEHTAELVRRFDKAPKPMAYRPDFLADCWARYLNENNMSDGDVNPDDFIRWTYASALAHRQPLYERMSRWGVTVSAQDIAKVANPADFDALIADSISQQA